jgi:hypothetical protein
MMRVRLEWYDAAGVALAAALAAWTVISAGVRAGNPWPQVALLAVATTVYVIGRTQGGRRPVFVPAAVVVSILVGTVASGPAALSGGPVAPPLDYGNANGALYTLGVAAACVVAIVANNEPVRRVASILGVVLLGLAVVSLSKTAVVLAVGILVIAIVAHRMRRWVVLVAPIVVVATVSVTIILGLVHGRLGASGLLDELSERRTLLWRESLEILPRSLRSVSGPACSLKPARPH